MRTRVLSSVLWRRSGRQPNGPRQALPTASFGGTLPGRSTIRTSANGTNRVNCALGSTVPYEATKSGGGGTVSGYLQSFYRSDRKVFLDGTGLGPSCNDYDSGTINIAGVGLTISNAVSAYEVYVSGDPQIPFELKDDDSASLPAAVDLSWFDRFKPAYVAYTNDGGGGNYNTDDVSFVLNLTNGIALDEAFGTYNGSTNCEQNAFWVGYIGLAWQPGFGKDDDPDSEVATLGTAWGGSVSSTSVDYGMIASVVYVEAITDSGVTAGHQRAAVHEMGHQFGFEDGTGGIMNAPPGNAFTDLQVHFGRCRKSSPGEIY